MPNLSDLQRALNFVCDQNNAYDALPSLILLSDEERLADPYAFITALPAGAAVIIRHRNDAQRREIALRAKPLCRTHGIMMLIAADPRLAYEIGADGLHLSEAATQRDAAAVRHLRRYMGARWIVTAAAHSESAMRAATKAGVDAVLLSPVFKTSSHPGTKTLGPLRFCSLSQNTETAVYALGGMNAPQLRRLKGSHIAGMAGISGFYSAKV